VGSVRRVMHRAWRKILQAQLNDAKEPNRVAFDRFDPFKIFPDYWTKQIVFLKDRRDLCHIQNFIALVKCLS
jgi:hypothetical protein